MRVGSIYTRRLMAFITAIASLFTGIGVIKADTVATDYPQLQVQSVFKMPTAAEQAYGATVNVTNLTGPVEDVTAYLVVYDEFNKLNAIKSETKSVTKGQSVIYDLSANVEGDTNTWYPKVMVWHGNGFDTMTPAMAAVKPGLSSTQAIMAREDIISLAKKVNNYWISNNPTPGSYFWDNAVYHTGNMEAYYLTGDEDYRKYSIAWAGRNGWSGPTASNWTYTYGENNVLFGDCEACFQTYIDLYNLEPKDSKVARAKYVMGYQVNNTSNNDYLWWIDSLYMVTPVMTKMYKLTGDRTYLDKLYSYYKYAKDYFCDDGTHVDANGNYGDIGKGLWYRDASYVFPAYNYNGQKVFWSRGDGWVVGAHVKILQDLPDDDTHKAEYIQTFKNLINALVPLQQEEGYWTRSLLIPDQAPGPESSGTMFFCYGLAYGINSGILDRETYLPYLLKGWNWLTTNAISSEGKVGYVQPIGADPSPGTTVSASSTANFGVGEFLLLAGEMAKLSGGIEGDGLLTILKKRMINASALKVGSVYAIANNASAYAGGSDQTLTPFISNNRTWVLLNFFLMNYGDITVNSSADITKQSVTYNEVTTDVSAQTVNNAIFVDADEMAQVIGEKVFSYNDLIVISSQIKPFNPINEEGLLNYLDSVVTTGQYPALTCYDSIGSMPEPAATMISIPAANVSASATPEAANSAANTVDRNYATRWSAESANTSGRIQSQSLTFNLGSTQTINKVGLSFYLNNQMRKYRFRIWTSADGTNYTRVNIGGVRSGYFNSSGNTTELEYYNFDSVSTKYVRIDFYGYYIGSTWGSWNSVTEAEIHRAE